MSLPSRAFSSAERKRAQESRAAIKRLYIAMNHLFIRGSYKPLGISGGAMIEALKVLNPEIYGSINDPEKVELDGLLYIFQRLPMGISACRSIRFISREGFEDSDLHCIVPSKRRRNSYLIDEEEMYIELTRGRSDIYDILTHLTFMIIESEKIRLNSEDKHGIKHREWLMLEKKVKQLQAGEDINLEVGFTYLTSILGRKFDEVKEIYHRFEEDPEVNSLFEVVYNLGKTSQAEAKFRRDREGPSMERIITFSPILRETIGHHHYGEMWADEIKGLLSEKGLLDRPLHIISANLHSVMNCFFAKKAMAEKTGSDQAYSLEDVARKLSKSKNDQLRKLVKNFALDHGMYQIDNSNGTNISVQIFDTAIIPQEIIAEEIPINSDLYQNEKPVLIVMDYAFGEQAYETLDELLKPYSVSEEQSFKPNIQSISIMGKAGILEGNKGDIMVPTAHVFEGTADNYPFENDFDQSSFENDTLKVFEGTMITVLGTSLQNKDILKFFNHSSWNAIGLEMEGAHYQKAIQSAAKIRNAISRNVKLRYAYYASDNPLITGHTLASGGLGLDGIKPTYMITGKILEKIFNQERID